MANPLIDRTKFIDYISDHDGNPFDHRTAKELYEELGISSAQFYRLRAQFANEIGKMADKKRDGYKGQIRARVYAAIAKNLDRSFNDRKLVLQLLGDFVEKSEVTTVYRTPEEKRQRAKELMDKLSAKLGSASGLGSINNSNSTSEQVDKKD